MHRTLLTAAAAFVTGGIATGAVLSYAQPAPPQTGPTDPMAPPGPPAGHHGMGGWEHHPGQEAHGWRHHGGGMRPFALIYRQPDRQLAPADVQKIVEGFLLWNGNHTWKVTDVAPMSDGPIGFSLTTPEGSVVAKFTMDAHTGRIERIG